MKTLKLLSALPLLISVTLQAQQAQWELVRENFWGTIAIDPTNPDIIYVSPGGNSPMSGMHKSTDGGKTWQQYTDGYLGGVVRGIIIDPNNPQRLWGFGPHIVRSEDGGETATLAVNGISSDHHGYQVTAMAYDNLRDILYAGNQANGFGVYRSFDGGRSWEHMSRFPYLIYPEFLFVVQDSGWIYTTGGQGLFQSKDFGVTWAQLQPELLDRKYLFSLAQVPNSRTLYTAGRVGLIYKSFDLGDHWFSISNAITDSAAFEGNVLVSNVDTNYVFIASSGHGIYTGGFFLTPDGGKNWQIYHYGLPDHPTSQWSIWALALDSSNLYMSIRTPIKSTYKLLLTNLTSVKERKSNLESLNLGLYPNYPNPFNTNTKIEFSLSKIQFVSLGIYDVTGEQVANLLNGPLKAGTHSLFWNGENSKGGEVASGIYLLSLRTGEGIITRKMLLIR